MTEKSGTAEKNRTLPVEWHEEHPVEIPLQAHPAGDVRALPRPVHLLHPDPVPPIRRSAG